MKITEKDLYWENESGLKLQRTEIQGRPRTMVFVKPTGYWIPLTTLVNFWLKHEDVK